MYMQLIPKFIVEGKSSRIFNCSAAAGNYKRQFFELSFAKENA